MILSDTHAQDIWQNRTAPLSKVDVLLHCGDLSDRGSPPQNHDTLDSLAEVDAELKLVIPGNHDLSLDKDYTMRRGEDPMAHERAIKLWTDPEARATKEVGVTYLTAGIHSFTLRSGATFTVYANPCTPEFCAWAFPYKRKGDDPFTGPNTRWPIRDTGIDIMMTHGPPQGRLDIAPRGNHAGCKALADDVYRAKPRIHCFEHIHEGYGAELVEWQAGSVGRTGDGDMKDESRWLDVSGMKEREKTLFVNAATLDGSNQPANAPWIIDLELPVIKHR